MSHSPFTIISLREGMVVSPEHFFYLYVQSAAKRTGRNGGKYLDLQLFDGVSSVNGKVWNPTERLERVFETGAVVHITDAKPQWYQGNLQLVISGADEVRATEIDRCCPGILPESSLSAEQLQQRWDALTDELSDTRCRDIVSAFRDDASVWERFTMIPAGKSMHHAYRRGLFEHTVTLAETAKLIAGHYRSLYEIDIDLVVTGALLHDVGKEFEFVVGSGMASVSRYSDAGRLLGHIYMGAAYLQQLLDRSVPDDKEFHAELLHIILSHHGSYEFGSPKLPMTMESMIVAAADNLDAHLSAVHNAFDTELDDRWTQKVFALQRNFYYSDYMKKQREEFHD